MYIIFPKNWVIARLLCHPVFTEVENIIKTDYFRKYLLLNLNYNFYFYIDISLSVCVCARVLCMTPTYRVHPRALDLLDLRLNSVL